jgi:hypothetical protein
MSYLSSRAMAPVTGQPLALDCLTRGSGDAHAAATSSLATSLGVPRTANLH